MINPNTELLSKLTHEGHIPGIAACWIQGGIPTQPLVLGCADVEKDIRVTPETRFEAASLSKMVLTVANKEESGDPHFKNNTFVRAMLKPAVTPAPHDQEDETLQGDLSEAPASLNHRGRNP